jgi:2-desacetyl-2-hydroxyethyl bacteriochlorophyllide A dehydrogenase
MEKMDALICVKPGELHIDRRPAPVPGVGEVLVRPLRVGICGTDYHIFQGKHPYLRYPRVMGHELAVEVVAVGSPLQFEPGDICVVNPYLSCGVCSTCNVGKTNCCEIISVLGVHQDGGMAGLLVLPAENLIASQGLTPDDCACVEFLAIGAHAVRRGAVRTTDRVLVVGAGPIGLGAALFARLSGGDVTVLDISPERCKNAIEIAGVSTAQTPEKDGFDLVLDATGNTEAMEKSFDYVAHGGRLVLVGVVTDSIRFGDPDFHRKEMAIFGSRNATNDDFLGVISAIHDGDVAVGDLITHRTGLSGAVDAIPVWARNKSGLIKAVIELDRA